MNGFVHDWAHDAMADVEAAMFLCRRIADAAPDVWSAFMRFSQKAAVADHILAEPIFCLSDFYFGRPYSWLVTVIGMNAELNTEYYVYNLAIDPDELLQLTDEELAERLAWMPKPVRRLKSNACPMIMPMEDAPAICVARSLGDCEVYRRAEYLRDHPEIRERLIRVFRGTLQQRQPSPHMEEQLYNGFFPPEDEALMQQFHLVRWEERPAIVQALRDPRLRYFGGN